MGWFRHKPPDFVRRECLSQYLLECHIGGIILTPMNSRRGWHSQNIVKGPRTCARAKMSHDQSQAFKEVNNSQAFTIGRKKWPVFDGRASRCSKACLRKVSRKYSKNWLCRTSRTNIKSNLTPEVEYTLKPSNYDPMPWFLHFTAQNSKCPRRFWELRPWHFAHVFNVSLPSLLRFLFFFRRKYGVF